MMGDDPRYAQWDIGDGTYGTPTVERWGEQERLTIGRYCSIADGVTIFLDGEHRLDWVTTYPFSAFNASAGGIPGHPASRGDVCIGHDVWIGNGAVILSGVSIGHGAVIGARCVVRKDVAPYQIVAGNPQRLIRERFSPSQVAALLGIAWWDWPPDRIAAQIPALLSGDIDAFIAANAGSQRPSPPVLGADGEAGL